jgi:hypothetical protein
MNERNTPLVISHPFLTPFRISARLILAQLRPKTPPRPVLNMTISLTAIFHMGGGIGARQPTPSETRRNENE